MTETTEGILHQLFHPGDIPEFALMGASDVETAFQRWQDREPARSSTEAWWYQNFARAREKERGADLDKARSKADAEKEAEL